MNGLKLLLLSIVLLLAARSDLSQNRFTGKVVAVEDGKTVVLEIASGKVTAMLQSIEIPEPDQPLRQTVKDHLGVLTLGKTAELQLIGMTPGKLTGRLFVDGVDIGQQMVRDGAAWLLPKKIAGNSNPQYDLYVESETAARTERRGLWSIPDLKPAWEFRADKERIEREKELDQWNKRRRGVVTNGLVDGRRSGQPDTFTSSSNMEVWADVYAGVGKETVGLFTRYDDARRFGMIGTSGAFVYLGNGLGRQKVECRALYVYRDNPDGTREGFLS